MIKIGGSFKKGERLANYWERLKDEETEILTPIFFNILEHYPKVLDRDPRFTERAWADLNAAVFAEVEDKNYDYKDFLKV
jgi:hypothetical protein